ncbi:MAG: D-tyrosyl-tRNA(Tyr) deacylase [Firmicutes bacterium ADurb.Bin080]|jgi:D-aminoacyl-tRNA deacylase|nr:D-tyrosyl-tRNA(Tyr) deacylase [Clostridiales bacterium]OQC15092.1 MAG: D-tyrosyl-tRNA(Tyr) deacylase [Firmicutes bacterium ADurb.Bin080]
MKFVIQRVNHAKLFVDGKLISSIGKGICVYLGISKDDTSEDILKYAKKIVALRIFENNDGKIGLSIKDISGEILLISQFTLLADSWKGNRPDFSFAATAANALVLYQGFADAIKAQGVPICLGSFGAHMTIEQDNDGPFTLIL